MAQLADQPVGTSVSQEARNLVNELTRQSFCLNAPRRLHAHNDIHTHTKTRVHARAHTDRDREGEEGRKGERERETCSHKKTRRLTLSLLTHQHPNCHAEAHERTTRTKILRDFVRQNFEKNGDFDKHGIKACDGRHLHGLRSASDHGGTATHPQNIPVPPEKNIQKN